MLKIYNSLTKQKETFKPIHEGKISLYACGVTVYDDCHIGHARTFIVFDMIIRYLKFFGFEVNFVRNITDIDDKIIKRANENNESIDQLTQRMIVSMHEDLKNLRLLEPSNEPRAIEHIDAIIALIQQLQENGYAYAADSGDVCFEVRKFEDYGKLSHRNIDELESGARIEKNSAKKDPLDFVLWKAAKPDEPAWDSPWGKGRPGWHIECSAMSTKLLGQPFDIHGGGLDLKFPHHENEIAQSEGAYHKTFANYWIHVGLLQIDKQKMSKSLDNFFTIKEVLKLHHPEVVRYLMVTSHYRSPLQYSEGNLKNAKASLERLYTALRNIEINIKELYRSRMNFRTMIPSDPSILDSQRGGEERATGVYMKYMTGENDDAFKPEIQKATGIDETYKQRFIEVMNDDFNTPQALSVLFDLAREINRNKENPTEAVVLANTLKTLGGVLGILQENPQAFLQGNEDDGEIELLIQKRNEARKNKDFKKADEIRDQLLQMGIAIEDSASGTTWRRM